ncbi:MAG: extracellular solute-binding protein [Spirochaetia bacterium]
MRKLAFFLCIVLVLGGAMAFAGGASEQKTTAAGATVELNTLSGPGPSVDWLAKRAQAFQDKTGVRVNITVVPYGRDQGVKLMASFLAGGSAYDVYVIDCVEVPQYVESGWVLPIDDHVTAQMKADLVPFAGGGMEYKGHWYGLPWASEWKSFLYNEKMLSDAGFDHPPKTWDEFVSMSQQLQSSGVVKYASAWSWAPKECLICDFVAMASSMGGQFFDEAQNPLFNKGGAVTALQWMADAIKKYKVADPSSIMWTENDVDKAIEAGDIAFGMRWGLPLVELNDPSISKTVGQWKIALLPSYDGNHPYTVSGPMGWAISFGTKHPKESWDWLNFIASEEGAKTAAIEHGNVPGWIPLFTDPDVVKAVPGLDLMLDQAKYVVNRPRVPWYGDFSTMFAVDLNNALVGNMSAADALNDAYTKTVAIKAKYQPPAK